MRLLVVLLATQHTIGEEAGAEGTELKGGRQELKGGRQKRHGTERTKIAVQMFDWYCDKIGDDKPLICRDHHLKRQAQSMEEAEDNLEHGKAVAKLWYAKAREAMEKESGGQEALKASHKEHNNQMHDTWCELEENAETDFCLGWVEFKMKREL